MDTPGTRPRRRPTRARPGRWAVLVALGLAGGSACDGSPPDRRQSPGAVPLPASPPTHDAPPASGPASAPAAPGATPQLPSPAPALPATGILVSATALEPAARVALDPATETVVDPGASFEIVLSATVRDARLVLLDAADAQLPVTGTTEVGGRTTLTLAPGSPLVPASRYVLRLEGATERNLHAASGSTHEPLAFALLAAGTPPPPEPPRKRTRRERRGGAAKKSPHGP